MHAHTSPASPCSQVKPEDVVKIFSDAGYHGIAITNHFFPHLLNCRNKEEYVEKYRKDFETAAETGDKLGIKVYLGAEIRFKNENDNDYLLFGFDMDELTEIYDYLDSDISTFVNEYKKDKMFLIQAHPFRDDMVRADTSLLDGIESFNMHPNHNSRIALAVRHAEENGKIMTIGTDYHHIGHDNLAATRMHNLPDNSSQLIQELKSGDYIMEVSGKLIL